MRVIVATVVALGLFAPPAFGQIQAITVGSGFTVPLFATSAPGNPNALYVVQQNGFIRSLNPTTGVIAPTPLLDLAAISGAGLANGGEQGLLGLAFHPNYQSNGLMYVAYAYNNSQPGNGIRVEQYHVTAGVAEVASRRTVLQYDHAASPGMQFQNHNGGWIGFNPQNGATGPNSGQLYLTTGDGGSGNDPFNNAQNTNSYLGKMLRVDVGNGLSAANPNFSIPAGNITGTTRPEIYSYGLRNSFRCSFDRANGNLFIGDVGQNTREEVNFIANGSAGGQNFGWRLREGTIATPTVGGNPPPGNVEPIFDYTHSVGQSITGGYVYHGSATDDSGQPLDGTYFFGDFVAGRIFSFKYNGTTVTNYTDRTTELGITPGTIGLSSFGEDGLGNLYMVDYSNGVVYRIVSAVPEPAMLGLGTVLGWVLLRRIRPRLTT